MLRLKYLFLSLILLLLNGYSQLSGQWKTDSSSHRTEKTLTFPDFANIRTSIDGLYISQTPLQTATYRISIPIFENEEDDDLTSFKKHLKSCNFPTLFLTPVVDRSFCCDRGIIPSYEYYSYTSSLGSIGLQTFRI